MVAPYVEFHDVVRIASGRAEARVDALAVEEPLEIRLAHAGAVPRSLSITMRTPGHDAELAAGFLLGEGIVRSSGDIVRIAGDDEGCRRAAANRVTVYVRDGLDLQPERLERHFYTTSSCGVCGKASLEAIEALDPPPLAPGRPLVHPGCIARLPDRLRAHQAVFERTGGLHAAALCTPDGDVTTVREDVGRHNAVDKVIGRALLDGRCPLGEATLMLSGRASFELMQKAAMAGIPIVAAVGAPSSLAVAYARRSGQTLLGFVRNGAFNVYAGHERIRALVPTLPFLTETGIPQA